ncbi:FAD-dependent oxidoreductase [Nesterenkonia pannonica]|uniref:FAD-dependent oxidoreductase n=1 Tax=Nesterenkonia pannonica TaxID=1548602 RepID=UPI00216417C8|nr:FAD-dependent oxidoreductase [Nesterenkonia pannonica]
MDTFLVSVMADSSGEKSADYARMLVRWFALGAPGLPEKGMQALPEQMASNLAELVRLRSPARELHETADGVTVTTDGAALRARLAVVAVGPEHVADLTALPAPVTHGLTTWWFRALSRREAGRSSLWMRPPGGGPAGPVWNTAVVSEAAPSYAPRGEHLVQATTLLDQPTGLADEAAVRRDLERIYRTSARRWELLTHHVVPHTLPGQPPPLRRHREQRINDRTLIAGDHLDQGSIEGAMASGDRAARTASSLLAGVRRG